MWDDAEVDGIPSILSPKLSILQVHENRSLPLLLAILLFQVLYLYSQLFHSHIKKMTKTEKKVKKERRVKMKVKRKGAARKHRILM